MGAEAMLRDLDVGRGHWGAQRRSGGTIWWVCVRGGAVAARSMGRAEPWSQATAMVQAKEDEACQNDVRGAERS